MALGVSVSVIGIAVFNARVYESPLTSGYGTTSDLYALRYCWTNLRQFAVWIADVETPVVALAAAVLRRRRAGCRRRRVAFARLLLGGSVLVVLLSYLFYQPFDVWWYLRFLLPMWPVMMLLTAAALDTIVRRWLRPVYPVAMAARRRVARLARRAGRVGPQRVRSRAERAPLHRRGAVHRQPHRSGRGDPQRAAQRIASPLRRSPDAAVRRARSALARSRGRAPAVDRHGGRTTCWTAEKSTRSSGASAPRTDRARSTGRRWRRSRNTIAVYDPIDRRPDASPLAIASTRGTHALCDVPQSWPPVLRMK